MLVADNDPRWLYWERQQARSLGVCGMQDDCCYAAKLYLMPRDFNRTRGGRVRSITLLNARVRSSGISSARSNTCYTSGETATCGEDE